MAGRNLHGYTRQNCYLENALGTVQTETPSQGVSELSQVDSSDEEIAMMLLQLTTYDPAFRTPIKAEVRIVLEHIVGMNSHDLKTHEDEPQPLVVIWMANGNNHFITDKDWRAIQTCFEHRFIVRNGTVM